MEISADGILSREEIFFALGIFPGYESGTTTGKANQKKTITTKTQQKAAPNTAAAQTQTAVMVVPGAAGWLVLKDSYFHWFGCLGKPEPVFSSDSNTHRNATHHTKRIDPLYNRRRPRQSTDMSRLIDRMATSPSNDLLLHTELLSSALSLVTRRSYSHSLSLVGVSRRRRIRDTRAGNGSCRGITEHAHRNTRGPRIGRTNPRNPDQRST